VRKYGTMKKYKVIAEGDFETLKNLVPAICFVGHQRDNKFKATIEIEELEELA